MFSHIFEEELSFEAVQIEPTTGRRATPRGSSMLPSLATSPHVYDITDPSSPALSTLSLSLPLPSPALSKLAPCRRHERRCCWSSIAAAALLAPAFLYPNKPHCCRCRVPPGGRARPCRPRTPGANGHARHHGRPFRRSLPAKPRVGHDHCWP